MREAFIDRAFQPKALSTIAMANTILAEYRRQGFKLTLRQLYYQFVARDLLPNTMRSYKNLGSVVSDGRMAGLIDWDSIEDRLRSVERVSTWESPETIIEAVAKQYKRDLWEGQMTRCEVWVEKDALTGVIEPTCRRLRVPWFACRGYVSQSAQYEAAQRFIEHFNAGVHRVVVFHLGDHDPSGIDMTRENREKINLLARADETGQAVEFQRLALNMDQVHEYRPPPNRAKVSDSRIEGYREEFGDESWELDALEPRVLADLIDDAVAAEIDDDLWVEQATRENSELAVLRGISERFNEVADFLGDTSGEEDDDG